MSNPHDSDAFSIYDADTSSDTASLEGVANIPNNYILRRKDSTSIEREPSPSKPSVPALKARGQANKRCHQPPLDFEQPKNPRRCGKADWRPDVSSVLFSASGRQYGLGDHQRGYHSNTYVTHLSYLELAADQPLLTIASAINFAVMSRVRTLSLNTDTTDVEDMSCADSIGSVHTAFQTDITSPSPSPHRHHPGSDRDMPDLYGPDDAARSSEEDALETHGPMMYGGNYAQDDVVGQYLARRDAQRASMEALQAPISHYVSEPAGYPIRGPQFNTSYESHANGSAQRWYPDPETIRHLHALHSLLPHISPERKLNALSGPEIDIIDGTTSQVLYSAAPKKLLVLFLGREVVNKFIRTFAREDYEAWRGLPTGQKLVVPSKATSAAALKILVSWMKRACTFATMHSMKPLRIPNNLFVACSLARTLEMFRLHRDAYRLDVAITQQFSSRRPVFAVEIETMWKCLGEDDKYVYACIRALGQRMSEPRVAEDLQGLAERCPGLWSRLSSPELNELYKPQFGRKWFEQMDARSNGFSSAAPGVARDGDVAVRPIFPSNHRLGFEETSDQSPQVLNPSAPPFIPMGSGTGGRS